MLNFANQSLIVARTDRVFTVDAFLTATECAELIGIAEAHGFESAGVRTSEGQQAMPRIRNNERALLGSPMWVKRVWAGLQTAGLPDIDGEVASGLPKDLRFYKYSAGQRFKMHKDGPWLEDGRKSRLTCLVYLNENFTGGKTDFRGFKIEPQTGRALLFIHDTWHEGESVTAGCKYVLRSDVMYA